MWWHQPSAREAPGVTSNEAGKIIGIEEAAQRCPGGFHEKPKQVLAGGLASRCASWSVVPHLRGTVPTPN